MVDTYVPLFKIADKAEQEKINSHADRELEKIPKEKVREIARQNIEAIKSSDRRDFRF